MWPDKAPAEIKLTCKQAQEGIAKELAEDIKTKPYYSIYLDLCKHPMFADNLEFTAALADFIHQNGYHKLADDQTVELLSDKEQWAVEVEVLTEFRRKYFYEDTDKQIKEETKIMLKAVAKAQASKMMEDGWRKVRK